MTIPLTQRCTWVRPGRVECKTRCPQNLLLPGGRVILWLSLSILTAYSIDESNSDRFRELKLRGFPKAYTLCKLSNIRTQAQPKKGSRRTGRTYEWVCGYAYLSGTHTNSSTFQDNENKSAISWEGLKTQQYSSGVEYKATSHFNSPPDKPLRACVTNVHYFQACALFPHMNTIVNIVCFVLLAFALFRTTPHFQFVSFHEDTDPYPRCNEPEYSANACSRV